MRSVPSLIVPLRAIGAEYFILWTLPALASLNAIILVEGNRRNLLWLGLRTKTCVLRLDLLHLLRLGLLLCARRHISLSLSLSARCRSGSSTRGSSCRRCRSRGCLRRMFLHPFLRLLRARRCTGGRLTFLRSRRFLTTLAPLSCTGLVHRSRFVARSALPHGCLVRLGRGCAGLCWGCLRLFSALLFLLSWRFFRLLRKRDSSQRQRTAYQ